MNVRGASGCSPSSTIASSGGRCAACSAAAACTRGCASPARRTSNRDRCDDAGQLLRDRAPARLVARASPRRARRGATASSANSSSRRSSSRLRIQPSPIAFVMSAASGRIRVQQPAPRRHAVRLVVEALRPELGEVRAAAFVFTSSECSAATPLTEWLPAIGEVRHPHVLVVAVAR